MKSKPSPSSRKKSSAAAEKAEVDRRMLHYLTGPHGSAAGTLKVAHQSAVPNNPEFHPDILALQDLLEKNSQQINNGDLCGVEATLASQATVLNHMFNQTTQLACGYKFGSDTFERTFRLALRAQAQSARTLEILANIKQGPRVVFAQQVNAAHQQIVNNNPVPPREAAPQIVRSAQNGNLPSATATLPEPSPLPHHAPLDARSPRETTPNHPKLAPVEKVHRTPHRPRKANQQPECR